MSKNNLLNLGLFLLVLLLGTVIYLSDEESTELEKLTDLDISKINSVYIRHNENSTRIARQHEAQWQITQPINIAANNFRINSLLKLLNAPVHQQYAITEIDAKTAGLEEPQTSIQFNDFIIEFGIINPATNLRYVKLNNTVYTIQDVYHPLLSSHFSTLVSLDLLPADSSLEKLVLLNQTISKDKNGLWKSSTDISADLINKTIEHWLHDQAFGIHQYMPREQLGEVILYLTNQPPVSYIITDTEPWLIIARPDIGLEYHLQTEAYNKLISPLDLNEK